MNKKYNLMRLIYITMILVQKTMLEFIPQTYRLLKTMDMKGILLMLEHFGLLKPTLLIE